MAVQKKTCRHQSGCTEHCTWHVASGSGSAPAVGLGTRIQRRLFQGITPERLHTYPLPIERLGIADHDCWAMLFGGEKKKDLRWEG